MDLPLQTHVAAEARWLARCAAVWCTQQLVHAIHVLRRFRVRQFGAIFCVESGEVGFTLIEIMELEQSAIERYGPSRVTRSVVTNRRRYLANAHASIRASLPQYYWVDPRSGSQETLRAVLQSFGLTILLAWYGIIPIVWLTDLPHRRMRLQAEILSAGHGVVLIMEDPRGTPVRLAHKRFHGPMPMPLSRKTFEGLCGLRSLTPIRNSSAVVVGSLYEPRISIVKRIQESLRAQGHELEVQARPLSGARVPNSKYWKRLGLATVVFTTADHIIEDASDQVDSPHLVYRYTEALAVGAPLVAPVIRDAAHLYKPGVHYAGYETEAEAVELLVSLLEDPERREELAKAGQMRIESLLDRAPMWTIIDSLGA